MGVELVPLLECATGADSDEPPPLDGVLLCTVVVDAPSEAESSEVLEEELVAVWSSVALEGGVVALSSLLLDWPVLVLPVFAEETEDEEPVAPDEVEGPELVVAGAGVFSLPSSCSLLSSRSETPSPLPSVPLSSDEVAPVWSRGA